MKISIVSKEDILSRFNIENLDSIYTSDATYWRFEDKIGWIYKFEDVFYGGFIIRSTRSSPEEYHEAYQILEQNAKETIEGLNAK